MAVVNWTITLPRITVWRLGFKINHPAPLGLFGVQIQVASAFDVGRVAAFDLTTKAIEFTA
jgi:hypothetical protein